MSPRRRVPGTQAIEYRKDSLRTQRCSRCHAERQMSVLVRNFNATEQLYPIMVGQDLVGLLCHECVQPVEVAIQRLFPGRNGFPFVGEFGELLPEPRCELGHLLVYAHDGRGMVCETCDSVERKAQCAAPGDCSPEKPCSVCRSLFDDLIGDALRAEPRCEVCGFNAPECRCANVVRE